MSRRIPKATKDQAFRLWLQGDSYRRICAQTEMSMGALSAHINELRERTPDLDQLRELNVVLRKGESTVFDAMRGGRLLDRVGRLGVSLDELENYVKLAERISHEREAEGFVESALRLMSLEEETGRSYGQVIKDFEGKLSEATKLEAEIGALKDEAEGIKARFEGQGLNWNDGVAFLKEISDLRAEKRAIRGKLTALKTELKEKERELQATKRTISRQRARVKELGRKIREQVETYNYYSDWLRYKVPKIVRYRDEVYEHTEKIRGEKKRAEMKLRQLQEEIQGANDRVKQLSMNVKNLEAAKEKIKKACQKIIDDAERKRKKLVEESRKLADELVSGAKHEKNRLQEEIRELKEEKGRVLEGARKEKERLEAEKGLVEAAIKGKLEKLRDLEKEKQRAVEEGETPAESSAPWSIFDSLPKLPPLPEEEEETKA